jgi:glycosyltransferase involved in cell wall biosynthesis
MRDLPPSHIAVLLSFSGSGGVERMVFRLCDAFAEKGHRVDLVLIKTLDRKSPILPKKANTIHLDAPGTLAGLPALVRYLRRNRPDAMLCAKDRANRLGVLAKMASGVPLRLILRMGTNTSAFLKERPLPVRWFRKCMIRYLYPRADGIVAISRGVQADVAAITGTGEEMIRVLSNPVVAPVLFRLAAAEAPHPWLSEKTGPVIAASGRLTRQKGFSVLIRAFAQLRKELPSRLIILGEGKERKSLAELAAALGVEADLDMPGFVENPYAFIKRADLFVLSSLWEGLGNALVEALALGVPAVATDCPSGPAEILQDGKYGQLVPVNDSGKMAEAMRKMLLAGEVPAPEGAAARYGLEESAEAYLSFLVGHRAQRAPGPPRGKRA